MICSVEPMLSSRILSFEIYVSNIIFQYLCFQYVSIKQDTQLNILFDQPKLQQISREKLFYEHKEIQIL